MLTVRKVLTAASLAAAAAISLGFTNTAFADDHYHPGYVHAESRGWHGDRYYDGPPHRDY